ncbi:VWA domain-containing protein [Kiritimatiellota bacterium B12222]|nr:VWA domain-containing protein [Kiritimatiellota bacterium B12222]
MQENFIDALSRFQFFSRHSLWRNHLSALFFSVVVNTLFLFLLLYVVSLNKTTEPQTHLVMSLLDEEFLEVEEIEELVELEEPEPLEAADLGDVDASITSSTRELIENKMSVQETLVEVTESPVKMQKLSEQLKGIRFADVLNEGKNSTRFMGNTEKGNRFAFVIDYSQSMSRDQLAVMKHDLLNAIEAVGEEGLVTVLFFSGPVWRPDQDAQEVAKYWEGDQKIGWKLKEGAEGPNPQWLVPHANNLLALERMIYQTPTTYGTDWYHPLKIVLDMEPRPDMVFFMTDGANSADSSEKTISYIKSLPPYQIRINTIALGVDKKKVRPLEDIAKLTGGNFRHYDSAALVDAAAKLPEAPQKFSKKSIKYLVDQDVKVLLASEQREEFSEVDEMELISFDIQ